MVSAPNLAEEAFGQEADQSNQNRPMVANVLENQQFMSLAISIDVPVGFELLFTSLL